MSSDCDGENRKLLKEIRINDREELMEDMKLEVVWEETVGLRKASCSGEPCE